MKDGGAGRKQVYWLAGAGPAGTAIIAKLMKRRTAAAEQEIYAEILPRLPVPSLRYYGLVDDGEPFSWTFLECASGLPYAPTSDEHRRLAGEWLGLMHAAASELRPLHALADRGPDHFFSTLVLAQEAVATQLGGTTMRAEAVALTDVARTLDALASRWDDVCEVFAAWPVTLVHGDFACRNLRVRSTARGASLEVFDWGESGLGAPPVDLTQAADPRMRFSANPSLEAYRGAVSAGGAAPSMGLLETSAAVGKVIRSLNAIKWEAREFGPRYRGGEKLVAYAEWMREGMREAGWGQPDGRLTRAAPGPWRSPRASSSETTLREGGRSQPEMAKGGSEPALQGPDGSGQRSKTEQPGA